MTIDSKRPASYRKAMTEHQIATFIAALYTGGLENSAAKQAGVTMTRVKKEYENNPGFKAQAEEAIELFNDVLENAAIRRAVEGVEKPVFYKGEVVGSVTEYSDTLLAKLLTGRRPEVYGNKQEISTNQPIAIHIAKFDDHDDIL